MVIAIRAIKYKNVAKSINLGRFKEVVKNRDGGYIFGIYDVNYMPGNVIAILVDNEKTGIGYGE